MEEHAASATALRDGKSSGLVALLTLQYYAISGDDTVIPLIQENLATIEESLTEAHVNEEIASLDEITARAASLSKIAELVIALRQSGDAEGATAVLGAAVPSLEETRLEIDRAIEFERQEVAALRGRADRAGDIAFWFAVIGGSAGAVLALAVAALIARSILRPLSSLESAAMAVAGGELEMRAPIQGPRELASLGASLNQMTESLLDASKRRELEEGREQAEEMFKTLANSSPIGIFVAQDGKFQFVNPQFQTHTGYSEDELLDTECLKLVLPEDRRTVRENAIKMLKGEGSSPYEYRVSTKGEETIWIMEKVASIHYQGRIATLGYYMDISERKRTDEELRRLNQELEEDQQDIEKLNRSLARRVRQRTEELRLANKELRDRNRQLLDARAQAATDSLTGLPNHRAFQQQLRDEVSQAEKNGATVGLIMLEIDGFKGINDSKGHRAGDEILRELASTIADGVNPGKAYRYGGDEFAVLLPRADRRKAAAIAERLRRAVMKRTNGDGDKITISLGVASFPDLAGSAEQLIYGADAAMYWAKSRGKNRVCDWAELLTRNTEGTAPWYVSKRNFKTIDAASALVAALAAKDPTTGAHVERCSWYALMLAGELGLTEKETSIARLASLLHDVGKIAVPDEVLGKPGPLNEEEWDQMKQHPTAALHVLSQIHAITDATPAILHHHERFDGSGYPDGLAGEEIPVVSRILLVTDAFDAMTMDRPYRKALSIEAAIEELEANSGSQFDPVIVAAFLKALSRHGAQPLGRTAASLRDLQAAGPRSGGSGQVSQTTATKTVG